jgi:hypothetical protein
MIRTLAAALTFAVFTHGAVAEPDVKRFFPDDLNLDGRITLTPGFTPDGQTMYFAQTECTPIWECPQRLKRSTRTATGWTAPEFVSLPQPNARVDYPSVTPDGTTLLFSWAPVMPSDAANDVDTNFDLWSLDLTRADAEPERLEGPDLNRVRGGTVKTLRYVNNEAAPILTWSGDLYFWGERLDAVGERDIFLAPSDGKGGFLKPHALPAPINSRGRDDGAWVSPDGQTMLVTYSDRGGCGGGDLFISHKADGIWSDPINLGCEINSPYSDFAPTIIPRTATLVFTSRRPYEDKPAGTMQLWTATLDETLLPNQ